MRILLRVRYLVYVGFVVIGAISMALTIAYIVYGGSWASKVIDETYIGKCVDLDNGGKGRVVKVNAWYQKGGPHVVFGDDYRPIANANVLVATGMVNGTYEAKNLKVVACDAR